MKSRKRKQQWRYNIRYCLERYGVKDIHDIWDDYYYEVAKQSWEQLHPGKHYELWYRHKHNHLGLCRTCRYAQQFNVGTDNEHVCCTLKERWMWPKYYTECDDYDFGSFQADLIHNTKAAEEAAKIFEQL